MSFMSFEEEIIIDEPKAPIQLISPDNSLFGNTQRVYREGIELEKGVVVNSDFFENNMDLFYDYWQKFAAYPDVFLDYIKPADSNFQLFPYQRLYLRIVMRYTNIFITAARATSKTFLSILAKYLQCIFVPNHVSAIVAPNIGQAAKISRQKIEEIWRIWPLLQRELEFYNGKPHANFGKDGIELFFRNGSKMSVVGALDSSRGLRTHATLLDEARDIDGNMIQTVILPQMNVSRRMANGLVNPYEKFNTQVIYSTSAGLKSSFSYEALIDILEQSIIDPKHNFCIGLDYRIPVMHGLIDKKYVNGLKLSPSYDETAFAQEYLGLWAGGGVDSWFNYDKLTSHRKIKNPEWERKYRDQDNVFYLLAVDVGRLHDQTVACVFRVNINDDRYFCTLVNIYVLGRDAQAKTFDRQAADIKRLIKLYEPQEVVIDTNGLGIGLGDLMIQTQISTTGELMPAYGFFNSDDYKKVQPADAPKILYSMKANNTLNSKIHSNAYARINSGLVRFLISEQEARNLLLQKKIGQKMSYEQRIKRLMPHELTTKLFEEMA